MFTENIKIGTMTRGGAQVVEYLRALMPHGFETYEIVVPPEYGESDLERMADEVRETLSGSGQAVSALGMYGNPLHTDDKAEAFREGWRKCIDAAELFGCSMVCGFTGRVVGKPIPESIPRFKEVFEPLAEQAGAKGVRLAFENCDMGGNWQNGGWNIAHYPAAWELMFEALPHENLGLEWEPCHQMVKLIDPLPQIPEWGHKFFHIHGKDATVLWGVLRKYGLGGAEEAIFHRTPGFGDSDWTLIISELRRAGFEGSIDIEGWHDPVYRDELEMMGQVAGLNHLKRCRGGEPVENPY